MQINITGNAGSGKTTLANKLGALLGFPVIPMDTIVWKPGWAKASPEEISRKVSELTKQPEWILDGVSRQARNKADLIVFLDTPKNACALRCMKRNLPYLFHSRPELPENCPEWKIIPELFKIIYRFESRVKPAIIRDINRRPGTGFVIKDKRDLAELSSKLGLYKTQHN